jgi:hypothetical protein
VLAHSAAWGRSFFDILQFRSAVAYLPAPRATSAPPHMEIDSLL